MAESREIDPPVSDQPPAETEAAAPQPRRSTRVASQSKTVEVAVPAKASNRKRNVENTEEGAEKTTTTKKAKKTKDEEGEAADVVSAPKLDAIDIGGLLPSVTLKNEKGEDVDVKDLAAEKGIVLFLVPKADTPGCTTQACGFRDIYTDFTSVDFNVYCLSADTPSAQTKWQTKKHLPYPLLSDPKRLLITALGAGEGGKTKRSHFIFKKGGKLVDKRVPVKAADSPKLALEFVKSL